MSEFRRRLMMTKAKASGLASYTINQTTQTLSTDMISVSPECTAMIDAIHNASHLYVGELVNGVLVCKQVSDTDKTLYADGTSVVYDGEKDMFMKLPQFWYKSEPNPDNDDICTISFTMENPNDPSWIEWEGDTFIGAYKGYVVDSKLYSRSGMTGAYTRTNLDNYRAYARAKGTGYSCLLYEARNIIALLGFGRLKSLTTRIAYGFGANYSADHVTGVCDSLGMNDGRNGNYSSFWGLESYITATGLNEFIDNMSISNYTFNVLDPLDLSIIKRTVQGGSPLNGNAWVMKLVLGMYGDIVAKERTTSRPSNDNGYGGYLNLSNTQTCALHSNNTNSNNTTFVGMVGIADTTTAQNYTTSRLCYKGNYQIIS